MYSELTQKTQVFLSVTRCHWASISGCFAGSYRVHLQGQTIHILLRPSDPDGEGNTITPTVANCFLQQYRLISQATWIFSKSFQHVGTITTYIDQVSTMSSRFSIKTAVSPKGLISASILTAIVNLKLPSIITINYNGL